MKGASEEVPDFMEPKLMSASPSYKGKLLGKSSHSK